MTREIQVVCGFCFQTCPGDVQVAMIERPGTDDQTEQFWFAHFGCFERALHPSARTFAEWEEEEEEGEGKTGRADEDDDGA